MSKPTPTSALVTKLVAMAALLALGVVGALFFFERAPRDAARATAPRSGSAGPLDPGRSSTRPQTTPAISPWDAPASPAELPPGHVPASVVAPRPPDPERERLLEPVPPPDPAMHRPLENPGRSDATGAAPPATGVPIMPGAK